MSKRTSFSNGAVQLNHSLDYSLGDYRHENWKHNSTDRVIGIYILYIPFVQER